MITFEILRQVKEMITRLVVYQTLNYNYFNEYYKMIAIDLSQQQALDFGPKAIHQINFT